MNPVIKEKIRRFSFDDYQPIFTRDLDLGDPLPPAIGNPISILSGIRHCGKTHRLLQEMMRLREMGVPEDRLFYFNFEDERFVPTDVSTGDGAIQRFFREHPTALDDGCYFFFDEIQSMRGWSSWLRRIANTYRATIYVSSSSSRSFACKLSDKLHGRVLEYELYPYSFAEYMHLIVPRFGVPPIDADALDPAATFFENEPLAWYLTRGGFPSVQQLPLMRAFEALQDICERVVLKDVVERRGLAHPRVATRFAQRALFYSGQVFSVRQSLRILRSTGVSTNQRILTELLEKLEDSLLIFCVRSYDHELEEKPHDPIKVYAIDPGLAGALSSGRFMRMSQGLENLVFLELLRRHSSFDDNRVSYYKTIAGHEVDFAVGYALAGDPEALYQVTWSLAKHQVLVREVRALVEAMEEMRERGGGTRSWQPPEATIIVHHITPETSHVVHEYLHQLGGVAEHIKICTVAEWLFGEQNDACACPA